jgi:hypothetical protein
MLCLAGSQRRRYRLARLVLSSILRVEGWSGTENGSVTLRKSHHLGNGVIDQNIICTFALMASISEKTIRCMVQCCVYNFVPQSRTQLGDCLIGIQCYSWGWSKTRPGLYFIYRSMQLIMSLMIRPGLCRQGSLQGIVIYDDVWQGRRD